METQQNTSGRDAYLKRLYDRRPELLNRPASSSPTNNVALATKDQTMQPIDAGRLGEKPLSQSLPEFTTDTEAISLSTSLTPTEKAKEETKELVGTPDRTATNSSFNAYINKLLGRQSSAELEDKYMGEADTARKELNDIQDQMRRLDLASRREQEEIRKNFQGTTTGLSQVLSSVQRQAASQMADLAIVEQAKLSNYSLMADIAERKIRMETERENRELDTLKFFYEENKADFDKKEKREFDLLIDERERALKQEENEKKTLSDFKLEMLQSASSQNAPANVLSAIQRAETPEDAITAAGQWGGDVLGQQLSRQKLAGVGSDSPILSAETIATELLAENPDMTDNVLINRVMDEAGVAQGVAQRAVKAAREQLPPKTAEQRQEAITSGFRSLKEQGFEKKEAIERAKVSAAMSLGYTQSQAQALQLKELPKAVRELVEAGAEEVYGGKQGILIGLLKSLVSRMGGIRT